MGETLSAVGVRSTRILRVAVTRVLVGLFVAGGVSALAGTSAQAETVAVWDFNTLVTSGSPATTLPADIGTGTLYLDGTNGSSVWTPGSTQQLTAFDGTASNKHPSTVTGTDQALVPLNQSANGKSAVFAFSMTGRRDLVVTYATRNTSSGFQTQAWAYSTDGVSFTAITPSITGLTTTFQVKFFGPITALNNAATGYLRVTFTGATSAAGNNRLDNIQLTATAIPVADPAVGTAVFSANPAYSGTATNLTLTLNNTSTTGAATNVVATLTPAVDGQLVAGTPPSGCSVNGNIFTCTAASIAASGNAQFVLPYTVASAPTQNSIAVNVALTTTGTNSNTGNDTGSATLTINRCGDAIKQTTPAEDCDDANTNSGDGCSSICVVEPGYECTTPGVLCTGTAPDVQVTSITFTPSDIYTGGATSMQVTLTNLGPAMASNSVTLIDLPSTMAYVDGGEEPDCFPGSGNDLECDTSVLDPNQMVTYTFAILAVSDPLQSQQTVTATVNAPNDYNHLNDTNSGTLTVRACGDGVRQDNDEQCDDGNPTDGDGCTSCEVDPGYNCSENGSGLSTCTPVADDADVAVQSFAFSANPRYSGEATTLNLVVVNNSTTATATGVVASITDVPSALTRGTLPLTPPPGCSFVTDHIECSVPSLAPLGTASFAIPYTVVPAPTANSVDLGITLTSTSSDPTTGNNSAAATLTINRCGDDLRQSAKGEACDDGNSNDSDGCSATCQRELNYTCTGLDNGHSTCVQATADLVVQAGSFVFNPPTAYEGGTTNLELTVTNNGPDAVDEADALIIFTAGPLTLGALPPGCGPFLGDILCTTALAAGEIRTWSIPFSVGAHASGTVTISEVAFIFPTIGFDPDPMNDSGVASFTLQYCGDGKRESSNTEGCDDGNANSGDGCSSCVVDSGFVCTENGIGLSTCSLIPKANLDITSLAFSPAPYDGATTTLTVVVTNNGPDTATDFEAIIDCGDRLLPDDSDLSWPIDDCIDTSTTVPLKCEVTCLRESLAWVEVATFAIPFFAVTGNPPTDTIAVLVSSATGDPVPDPHSNFETLAFTVGDCGDGVRQPTVETCDDGDTSVAGDTIGCKSDCSGANTGWVCPLPGGTCSCDEAQCCDPVSGAATPIDDGSVCTTDACNPGTGAVTHTQIDPTDNNVCTADACDPVNGPSHDPAFDGTTCQVIGTCLAGTCRFYDYGDAGHPVTGADAYGTATACWHLIDNAGPILGTTIDAETAGSPSATSDGDGPTDDAIIGQTIFNPGIMRPLLLTVSGDLTAFEVEVYVDFNRDGVFADPGERFGSADEFGLVNGDTVVVVGTTPITATVGLTAMRVRVARTLAGIGPSGGADDGEVEDYQVSVARECGDITVNSLESAIDANDNLCTLPEAVIAANTNAVSGPGAAECNCGKPWTGAQPDQVYFNEALFPITAAYTIDASSLLGGLALTEAVAIHGVANYRLTVVGKHNTPVFTVQVPAAQSVAINHLDLRASADAGFAGDGYALNLMSGTTVLSGVTASGGVGVGRGAWYVAPGATLNAFVSAILGNSELLPGDDQSQSTLGGGLYCGGTCTLESCTIRGKRAVQGCDLRARRRCAQ